MAVRPVAPLLIGVEAGFYRHYDSLALKAWTGDALYVGPTLYWQIRPKMFMTAAWSMQVSGHDVENPGSLNLSEFSRQRAKFKLAMEF